jgi:NADPH2:quinone reductase
MRALVLRKEHEMPSLENIPEPEPGNADVLVRVGACGVNFADTMMRRGVYLERPKFPFVPGFEFSGTVVRPAGPWSAGDRVMGIGAWCYAEVVSAPASTLMPVPAGFSDLEAAAFPVTYLTAMGILRLAVRAKPGETMLILAAAGGVGTAAIQLAKALDLTVIGAAGSDEKLGLARTLGADHAINYSSSDLVSAVQEVTDGLGANIILESLGGSWLSKAVSCAAPFGRVVVFGSATGPPAPLSLMELYKNSVSIGAFWLRSLVRNQDDFNAVLSELIELVESHHLRPVIGNVYPLEDGAQAWQDLESRRSTGKLLLQP